MNKRGWVTALLVALLGTPAAAKTLESEDKIVRVVISDEWKPALREKNPDDDSAIRATFRVPNWDSNCYLRIRYERSGALTERTAAYDDEWFWEDVYSHREVRMEPRPHLIAHEGGEARDNFVAIYYRTNRGNLFSVEFRTLAKIHDEYQKLFLEVVDSLTADLVTRPVNHPDYKTSKKNGFLILKHPSIRSNLSPLKKALAASTKRFTAQHGKLPGVRHGMPQINVLAEHSQRSDFKNEFGTIEFDVDWPRLQMFCKPLGKDAPPERVAAFASEHYEFQYALTYGSLEPRWLSIGLGQVIWSEFYLGKKLPRLSLAMYRRIPPTLVRFDDMVKMRGANWGEFNDHAFAYVALFLDGPAIYKKAYKSLLADLRETGDWRAATGHILALDQNKLHKDALKYIRKRLTAEASK
ncbi:MAG: hypothetical protein V3T86_15740 [Planctomycetota bacterium]